MHQIQFKTYLKDEKLDENCKQVIKAVRKRMDLLMERMMYDILKGK